MPEHLLTATLGMHLFQIKEKYHSIHKKKDTYIKALS